jgi:hypothetical protein
LKCSMVEVASTGAVFASGRRLSGAVAITTIPSNDRRARPGAATEAVAVVVFVNMTTSPFTLE